jgi:hypothetical protein
VAFFPQELAPGPVPEGDVVPVRTSGDVKDKSIRPQTRRTFLIVLAYGRIEYPTKALEGAIDLVRNRLLPQDVVAVMAFHRTTVFTRDHERIAQVLERYRKVHEDIVDEIRNYRSMARAPVILSPGAGGISAPPGEAPIPDRILKRIDDIFLGPPSERTPATSTFIRNISDLLIAMDRVVPVVEKPGQYSWTFGSINKILRDYGEPVNDEVLLNTKLKFYAGVEYLRPIEGDKHILFFSGLSGGGALAGKAYHPDGRGGTTMSAGGGQDLDEAAVLAQRASDARVVVDLVSSRGDEFGRRVTELTGGFYSSLDMATKAVAKIDDLTRFSYLLGYTPSNPDLDGRFRDVDVRVNRPGLTVKFRHGYFAADEPPPVELERAVKAARIETALGYDQEAKDIPLQVAGLAIAAHGAFSLRRRWKSGSTRRHSHSCSRTHSHRPDRGSGLLR